MLNKLIRYFLGLFKNKSKRKYNKKQLKFYTKLSPENGKDYLVMNPKSELTFLDYSIYINEIKNQGSVGSCVTNAGLSGMEMLAEKRGLPYVHLSELDAYWLVRQEKYMNTFPKDSGLYPRQFLRVMQKEGVCPEVMYPYDPDKYNDGPGIGVASWRKFFKIKDYYRCYNIEEIQSELEKGKAVFCTLSSYYSFMRHYSSLKYTLIKDSFVGYHQLLIVGFDKYREELKLLNSYDKSWGENGFFTISYADFKKIFQEAWSFDI